MTAGLRSGLLVLIGLAVAAGAFPPASQAQNECSTPDYHRFQPYQEKWGTSSHGYYTALDANLPNGSDGRTAITWGQLAWTYTWNDCGMWDQSAYAAWWQGGVCCWSATNHADGISYIDWGPAEAFGGVCGFSTVLACEDRRFTFPGGVATIQESDIRIDDGYYWNGTEYPQGWQYDLESVATHEAGHSLGLAHAPESKLLTMYPSTQAGTIYQRMLGWGDYTGMQAIYP